MKNTYLNSISAVIIILTLLSCTNNKPVTENLDKTTDTTQTNTSNITYKGMIVSYPFVNKVGEEMPEYAETYFLCSKGEFYIKKKECNFDGKFENYINMYVEVSATIKDGLWDTNDPNMESRVGPYITIDKIEMINTPIEITYNDGSANSYIITLSNFRYNPVTPTESSSGTYSGGEPKDFDIDQNIFNEIFILAESIATNEDIKIETRQMGTGFINIAFENTDIKAHISNCPELEEFENHLQNIK